MNKLFFYDGVHPACEVWGSADAILAAASALEAAGWNCVVYSSVKMQPYPGWEEAHRKLEKARENE